MPSITGGDQLDPSYAPWAWIGPDDDRHLVWQTSQAAEHGGWLYRAGMIDDTQIVCERRPTEDAPNGNLMKRDRIETVPVDKIPEGLFPNFTTMSQAIDAVRGVIAAVEPTEAPADQLETKIRGIQQDR